jgi:hypothetical protein
MLGATVCIKRITNPLSPFLCPGDQSFNLNHDREGSGDVLAHLPTRREQAHRLPRLAPSG